MKQKKFIAIMLTFMLVAAAMFSGAEAVFANTAATTHVLKSGKTYSCSNMPNEITYYKITSPSNGYLEVSFTATNSNDDPFYMSVLNKDKKNLYVDYELIDSSKRNIGVAKGTYYLAVRTAGTSYKIKATHHAIKESSGSKQSTAKKITKGNFKKGIITAGQSASTGDWYKFTISKSQAVRLSVQTKTSGGGNYGGLKVTIHKSGKTANVTELFSTAFPSNTIKLSTDGYNNKLASGTYYIKVQKYNTGNGYYRIKWL